MLRRVTVRMASDMPARILPKAKVSIHATCNSGRTRGCSESPNCPSTTRSTRNVISEGMVP
ncbi:hypothetical protein Q664_26770 [Archangium violaceum Cb vi76]|uniref:Uncharacterized protein n=1 Tax=Archangium violaceum Cb vi76 TaxID=1406225 RepID=A0A084SQI6_9BACT|nr:hypothetical protein Q664_26770 [Archangium violaceum Cb vi76]